MLSDTALAPSPPSSRHHSCFLTAALNWLCFLLAQLESCTPAPCWSLDSSEDRISGQRGLSAPRKPKPLRWGRFYLLTTSGNCTSICPCLLCGRCPLNAARINMHERKRAREMDLQMVNKFASASGRV